MWECPDLFQLDGQWFLAVSPQGIECQNVYGCGYFPIYGDWRRDCILGNFHHTDLGFDYYAPQSFTDETGRRIQIGWMGMPDAAYGNAATVAYASTDTILLTEDLGDRKVVKSVPERPNTFRAQTPQAFRFGTIVKAYELAAADPDFHPTDDTRVVVDYLPDEPVAIVDGSETNLKITTPSDMPIAEGIARSLDPEHAKEEAKARMHAVFAEAFSQMHSR